MFGVPAHRSGRRKVGRSVMEDVFFDELVDVRIGDESHHLVIHRGPLGDLLCYHSPRENAAVECAICKGGARVYLRSLE